MRQYLILKMPGVKSGYHINRSEQDKNIFGTVIAVWPQHFINRGNREKSKTYFCNHFYNHVTGFCCGS